VTTGGGSSAPFAFILTSVQTKPMTLNTLTADEMAVLYDLVCFHDECPDWMNLQVFESVQDKISDAYHQTT